MKTYIIHSDQTVEREPLVQALLSKTNAQVFPAVMLQNGGEGCTTSHFTIYEKDADDVLVFEDDCEILSDNFLEPLQHKHEFDVIFLGVNAVLPQGGSYGTHALWISAHAKQCFLQFNGEKKRPIDHLWNDVERTFNLRIWRPNPINKYVQQKKGLRSLITRTLRT